MSIDATSGAVRDASAALAAVLGTIDTDGQ
jgi:hypothetical protein